MIITNNNMFFDVDNSPFSILDIVKNTLMSKKDKARLLVEKYKPIILDLLQKEKNRKDGLTTSQIARKLNLDFEDTHFILSELEKEGLLRIT